jgi:uncharacterized protein (DUF1684 family)
MAIVGSLIEEYKQDLAHAIPGVFQVRGNGVQCDACRFTQRVPIGAGTDRGKTDRAHIPLFSQRQAALVAAPERGRFAVAAIAENRSDRVENVLRRQRTRARYHRISRRTTPDPRPDLIQLAHDRRPSRAMNRAVHSAAAMQAGVGGIHYGVDANSRDIADHQPKGFAVGKADLHICAIMVAGCSHRSQNAKTPIG